MAELVLNSIALKRHKFGVRDVIEVQLTSLVSSSTYLQLTLC
jgi:hypothetical protein